MIFINDFPKIAGASDLEDSSHLAGILAITEHPQAVDCTKYVVPTENGLIYIRCPETKYDFSRDQFILLAAGLIKQGHGDLVNLAFVTGRDIMPPSVHGLVRIAQGKRPLWYQSLWLKTEIMVHAYFQKLDEPFQILALCSVYGDEYLKLWTSKNSLWRESIKRYLCELDGVWRGEKELAEHIIEYVSKRIA